mgnify:CR=1 FL=1
METPIADFVRRYADSGMVRAHMPGHKGKPFLGCEALDITEIRGADSLYEADGIIRRSEFCAGELFGSGRTVYSTEGSSQCIRAMLYLALSCGNGSRTVVAARNVHRAFVYAAALLDFEIVWLWPEQSASLCGCPVSPGALERTLAALPAPPAAVYLTSPDYLGGMADISALAEVCRKHGTLLAVDNAHGAYLRFLEPSRHPLDLGADLCCDSAHKTLPVLTGGAYLHISRAAPASLRESAKTAMAMFGSTSPSYLTLSSLDLCNRYLADGYRNRLRKTCGQLDEARKTLAAAGWQLEPSDPLRLTIKVPSGTTGGQLADRLRENGAECEYAEADFLVLMLTPENGDADIARLIYALGTNDDAYAPLPPLPLSRGEQVCSVREALFAPRETIPAAQSLGRVCGAPTVGCPPAIPIAVSGERIGPEALELFRRYGVEQVEVLR